MVIDELEIAAAVMAKGNRNIGCKATRGNWGGKGGAGVVIKSLVSTTQPFHLMLIMNCL